MLRLVGARSNPESPRGTLPMLQETRLPLSKSGARGFSDRIASMLDRKSAPFVPLVPAWKGFLKGPAWTEERRWFDTQAAAGPRCCPALEKSWHGVVAMYKSGADTLMRFVMSVATYWGTTSM